MSFGRAILSQGLLVASGFGHLGLENSGSVYVAAVPLGGKSVKSNNKCSSEYQTIVDALNAQFNATGGSDMTGAGFYVRTVKPGDGAEVATSSAGIPYCQKFSPEDGVRSSNNDPRDQCWDNPQNLKCAVFCNSGYLQKNQNFVSTTYLRRDVMWKLNELSDVNTEKECLVANSKTDKGDFINPSCPFFNSTTSGGIIFDYETSGTTWPPQPKCYFTADAGSQQKNIETVCTSGSVPLSSKRFPDFGSFVDKLKKNQSTVLKHDQLVGGSTPLENEVIVKDWGLPDGKSADTQVSGIKAFFLPMYG